MLNKLKLLKERYSKDQEELRIHKETIKKKIYLKIT